MVDDLAYGLSKRRVTVSTAGIVPGIERLAESSDISLAVSLHSASDEVRDQLEAMHLAHLAIEEISDRHWIVHGKVDPASGTASSA